MEGFLGINPGTPNIAGNVGPQYLSMLRAYDKGESQVLNMEEQYKPWFVNEASQNAAQAQPDWLNLYGTATGSAQDTIGAANTTSRWTNVGDTSAIGPSASAAVRSVNPSASALTDQLTATASSQLAAGTRLDPADVNRVTQGVRADWSNRGLGDSAPAMLDEAVQEATAGQNVLAQREGAATNAINENSWITNPALALTEGTSSAPAAGMELQNTSNATAQAAAPTLISPAQSYDALNTNFNAAAASQIAAANNAAGIEGGLLSY